MNRRVSPEDLVLPRVSLSANDIGQLNRTFSLQDLDLTPAIENTGGNFYELVQRRMAEKGIDRDEAMDSVRLQLLIDACDTKENTALYLLEEWNYEPQVYRFLKLLCDLGTKLEEVKDSLHNTSLHLAATKNYVTVAEFLIDSCPTMLLASNGQGELPVETAIKDTQDEVAAFLIRKMDHRRVKHLFIGEQHGSASINFAKITEEFKMQETIVAVLDCLISPRWPHPPCLPCDVVPCLSWEHLQDTPTHFHVSYDVIESDICGRLPDDPQFDACSNSCFYHLAKHCQTTLNEKILNHVVIKLLTERKWKKYAAFWFRIRTATYSLFLGLLGHTLLAAMKSDDPSNYENQLSRLIPEVLLVILTFWFLLDEITEFRREPLAYLKDVFNYLDLSGYSLIIVTLVFRYLKSDMHWTFASSAVLINFLGVFKYSIVDGNTGMYVKCLGKVIYRDIPRFIFVFGIILVTFSLSYYLALRGHHPKLKGEKLVNQYTIRKEIACTGNIGCIMMAGILTWLEGTTITSSFAKIGWQGSLLIGFFMLSVTIIMMNILIAQLSLTYELVQEESLLSFTAVQMQSVSTVDWQSRFKYWNLRKKYYVPGEMKTRAELEELLKHQRAKVKEENTTSDQLKRMEQRMVAMETHLRQLRSQLTTAATQDLTTRM